MIGRIGQALAALGMIVAAGSAAAQDKVVFATNWKAQPGHGGFYQALADGTYKKYGLDVEIQQGGPQVNNRPLLPTGKIDFLMAGNLLLTFDAVKNGVPITAVAAIFQKDPQALFAHPNQGYQTWDDLKKAKTIFISKDGQFSFWLWMKAEHGFKDEQLKPYTFNLAPWLSDKTSVQQGYSIAEPIAIEKQGGFKPLTFLLADQGWTTYSTTIETRTELVQKNPDLVRRFVEASILGWYNWLYGDNKAARELIKKDNPDMSDELIDKGIALIKELQIVDSGDALTKGIGVMDPARVKDFHDKMVRAGVIQPNTIDLSKVAVYDFVGKGVGLDVKKALGAK